MIEAQAAQPFTAIISGAPTGQVGQITIRIVDPPDTIMLPETAEGIVESASVPGTYSVTLTAPTPASEPHTYWVVWHGPGFADLAEDLVVALADVHAGSFVVDPDRVLAAVESLMAHRLRVGGFNEGGGGRRVEHLTAETTPTLARATEVSTREAAAVGRDYPAAAAVDAEDLVTIAALRAAIELEGSSYPDQVESGRSPARLWLDLLATRTRRVDDRLGAPARGPTARFWSVPMGPGPTTLPITPAP